MRHRLRFAYIVACLTSLICMSPPAHAAVSLDLTLVAPDNLQVFFLVDLNISGQAPAAQVFRVTVTSTDPANQECTAVFSMTQSGSDVAHGESRPFTLYPGVLQLTNLDLTSKNSPYALQDYEISSSAQDIENRLMETGYFPSGAYVLRLELHAHPSGALLAADEATAVITNPFTIQLLYPAGTPDMPTPLGSNTPILSWSSSATQFLLKVCERTSTDQDPESVMRSHPLYETEPSAPLTTKSFPYPASGVQALEPGHVYYWQVTSLVQTSSERQEYSSPIAAFSIISPHDPQSQRIMLAVQRILASEHAGVLNDLSGYMPGGQIRLDGVPVTIEHLEEIASKFEQGQYRTALVRTK